MKFRSFREIIARPTPPPDIAIEGICTTEDLIMITGGFDSFKSTFAMELGWSLASGEKFLRLFPVKATMKIGIIQVEINQGFYDIRVASYGKTSNLFAATQLGWRMKGAEDIAEIVVENDLDGLVLDPIGKCWPLAVPWGENESFSENMNEHVSPLLGDLKAMGKLVVLVHHDPKEQAGWKGRARGSSALLNDPDVRIMLDREEDGSRKTLTVSIRNRLQNPPDRFKAFFKNGRLRGSLDREERRQYGRPTIPGPGRNGSSPRPGNPRTQGGRVRR